MRINTIWITGAHGRLGSTIFRYLDPLEAEIIATDKDEVDITNQEEVNLFVDRNRPKIIINCSALTNRLKCEKDPDKAYLLNALGAKNIAIASNRVRAKLIQLSTADVFDGQTIHPYKEIDKAKPNTVYGKSKFMGEEFVKDFANRYFIVRVSRLYSKENNLVESIIEEAKKGIVTVPKSRYGSPTSAYELSKFLISIMDTNAYGTYHASCEGTCSFRAFAQKILDITKIDAKIEEKRDSNRIDFEPAFRGIDNYFLNLLKINTFSTWEDALEEYLRREYGYEK
ncbi:SDR family oxidoreductase [Anaerococcus rubeinfantis]|uniref:SDR family oxidoreductase n=1 Tax=Anaerococcus rubeinfantis TaxID=1720199 RepID=UPI00073E7B7C|nr:NAD(P)-dependent oxidoreductase [Anaerococcus rubeinfantis]